MENEFKDIKGFEGKYLINKDGIVKGFMHKKWVIINPYLIAGCYLMVTLYFKSKAHSQSIHRLLALNYIPNPNNYPQVNHIDGNKQNNSLDNLEWCTRSQNMLHAIKLGLYTPRFIKGVCAYPGTGVAQYDLNGI